MKILNLYAGIGGNRKLWTDVKVTAVENNPDIALVYSDFFPNDEMIVADAHQYLLDHHSEFDFIWSSPPCPTHSHIRKELGVGTGMVKPVYPDMKLYEEILLLKHYFKGKWVVENVRSFYIPLIKPYEIHRHYFWSNFSITDIKLSNDLHKYGNNKERGKVKGFDLAEYQLRDKRKALRNCVKPEVGKHVFDCAFKLQQKRL